MTRYLLSAFALLLSQWIVSPARACGCEVFRTCNEVASSNLIFIGTVEAIEPGFFSRWNTGSHDSLTSLNRAYLDAQQHPSNDTLGRLKDAYLKTFPEATADRKVKLQSAKTAAAVASLFYGGMGGGLRVRLHVQTLFKHSDDDDDPKPAVKDDDSKKKPGAKDDDDDRKKPAAQKVGPARPAAKDDDGDKQEEYFEVATPFGDCGISFQVGETYLIYASDDEEANDPISTDACTRTRRLSEAGEDLAYLYFYKNHPEAATRLEGYLTSDSRYRLTFDPQHPELIHAPVTGPVVKLESGAVTRFFEVDRNGQFLFDGLPEGDYTLSAYAHGYPADPRLLSGPQPFHLEAKSCSLQVLVLPPEAKPK